VGPAGDQPGGRTRSWAPRRLIGRAFEVAERVSMVDGRLLRFGSSGASGNVLMDTVSGAVVERQGLEVRPGNSTPGLFNRGVHDVGDHPRVQTAPAIRLTLCGAPQCHHR